MIPLPRLQFLLLSFSFRIPIWPNANLPPLQHRLHVHLLERLRPHREQPVVRSLRQQRVWHCGSNIHPVLRLLFLCSRVVRFLLPPLLPLWFLIIVRLRILRYLILFDLQQFFFRPCLILWVILGLLVKFFSLFFNHIKDVFGLWLLVYNVHKIIQLFHLSFPFTKGAFLNFWEDLRRRDFRFLQNWLLQNHFRCLLNFMFSWSVGFQQKFTVSILTVTIHPRLLDRDDWVPQVNQLATNFFRRWLGDGRICLCDRLVLLHDTTLGTLCQAQGLVGDKVLHLSVLLVLALQ